MKKRKRRSMPIDPVIKDPFGIEEGGLHLVEASAGTGKTTLLSVLFLKAIIVWNHPVDKIAVITFTRAATQELLKRIRKELLGLRSYLSRRGASTGSEVFPQPIPPLLDLLENVSPEEASSRIERAILDFDRVVIRTIHSFYQGLLSEIMHLAGITEEREVVTRTEPYVFEATARFLRDDLERIHPALRRYWFQKGITTLAFYNGDFLENPKPDPSRLTSRVISLAQGGWPVSDPELLSGPGIDLLEEAFAQVFEKKQIVNELSVEDHSSERTKLLSDADFPFNILCAKSDQSLKIKGALDAQKTQNPVLKKALVELSASMDFLRERWEEASKAFVRRMMDHVGKILEENKKAAQIRFQDDALLLLLGILEKEEKENPDSPDSRLILAAIRSKFKVFLVDEFQDTDPSQISLLLKIGKNDSGDSLLPTPSMVFVGDPKQSIYHFRGADLQSYIRFREKMGGHVYGLLSSYRQSSSLLSALNFLYSNHPSPFSNPHVLAPEVYCASSRNSFLEVSGKRIAPMRILVKESLPRKGGSHPEADDTLRSPEDVLVARSTAREIHRILCPESNSRMGEKPVLPSEIAVLVRKTREAHEIEKELSLLGIPSLVEKDGSVLDSSEARELEWILLAILGQGGFSGILAALTSELVGEDYQSLKNLSSDLPSREEKLRSFSLLRKEWESSGIYRMGISMISALSIENNLAGRIDGKRKWINLNHLLELLNLWESQENLLPERLLARFSRAIRRSDELPAGEEEILRAEGAANAVRIMTVHKAKGLEFDMVFCPFVLKPGKISFPLKKREPSISSVSLPSLWFEDEMDPETMEESRKDSFSEELRILYVALTRARYHVSIVLNDQSKKGGFLPVSEPSPFLWLLLGMMKTFSPENPEKVLEDKLSGDHPLTPWILAKMAEDLSGGTIVAEPLEMFEGLSEPFLQETILKDQTVLTGPAFEKGFFPDRRGWIHESFTSMAHFFEDQSFAEDPFPERDVFFEKQSPRGGLARGARTGTLIHELLENADMDTEGEKWIGFVRSRLELRGFLEKDDLKNALEMVAACRTTPIDGASLKIGEIPREKKVTELAFSFPMEQYNLSRFYALLRNLSVPLPEKWGLESSAYADLNGMLSGAVDLFFFHEGRVAFVDYKTNDLGPNPMDYSQESLRDALTSGGYFLQALLYTVALHRHMKACIGASYSYERDFGGGTFLFLRGLLPPRLTKDQGVFKIIFPFDTIRAVEAFFDGRHP